MTTCWNCHNRLPEETARYCPRCGATLETVATHEGPGPGTPGESGGPALSNALAERITRALLPFAGLKDFFLGPGIPEEMFSNAMMRYEIPGGETMLALMDCTIFDSGKNGAALTLRGLYYHNGWTSTTPGPGFVSYEEFPQIYFVPGDGAEIKMGSRSLNFAGSSLSREQIIAILNAIKKVIVEAGAI